MNRIILIIVAMICVGSASAQSFENAPEGARAILMVHFGTLYDDTRSASIDAINEKVKEQFPGTFVAEAYTSRIIIQRLKSRGIIKETPLQALLRLAADGYTHVIVQGTNVIDGIEAEVLRQEAASLAPFFKEIRVGHPLLYSVEDCRRVAGILVERHGKELSGDCSVVLVGHGTSTPANAIYSQMDYIFSAEYAPQFHVATVEGYPTYETTLSKLHAAHTKSVTLVPFMFVAGDHARNDIDGEWREHLIEEGFEVSSVMEGLGQISGIQDIYIEHIKDAFKAPVLDAAGKKTLFIKENL